MQLFALSEQGEWVAANQGQKGAAYRCPECQAPLRIRGGEQRRLHFYHLRKTSVCRQAGKTKEHIQAQLYLLAALPKGEAHLEHPFPTIGRIADLYWEPQKLVFEIQYSSIAPLEIKARNQDYESVGCRVIWILHDQSYNQRRLKSAETTLANDTFYYTNIDAEGDGYIYDQLRAKGEKLPRLKVEPGRPLPPPKLEGNLWLPQLLARQQSNSPCFQGDALYAASQPTPPVFLKCIRPPLKLTWRRLFAPLQFLLNYLLLRATI